MKNCCMPLPGNAECPNPPMYVVTSSLSSGYDLIHRRVCCFHLVNAIDNDVNLTSGVTVRMAIVK